MDLDYVAAAYDVVPARPGAWTEVRSTLTPLADGRWRRRVQVDRGSSYGVGVASGPPGMAWSSPLRHRSSSAASPGDPHHDGVALLVDTAALWDRGVDGTLLLHAVSTTTGSTVWERPLAVVPHRRWSVLPGVVLLWTGLDLEAYDPLDGTLRWRRPWTASATVRGLRLRGDGRCDVVLLSVTGAAGDQLTDLDTSTGATGPPDPATPVIPAPARRDGSAGFAACRGS